MIKLNGGARIKPYIDMNTDQWIEKNRTMILKILF